MEFSLEPMAILRVLCGIWFLPHCIGKMRHVGPASVTFAKAGFHPARAFVIATIIVELIAGAGMVFNVFPRLAAGMAVAVLLGASYAVLKINGWNWRWQRQGPEFMLFWSTACILSVLD
jgi:putative oxidoreductase